MIRPGTRILRMIRRWTGNTIKYRPRAKLLRIIRATTGIVRISARG